MSYLKQSDFQDLRAQLKRNDYLTEPRKITASSLFRDQQWQSSKYEFGSVFSSERYKNFTKDQNIVKKAAAGGIDLYRKSQISMHFPGFGGELYVIPEKYANTNAIPSVQRRHLMSEKDCLDYFLRYVHERQSGFNVGNSRLHMLVIPGLSSLVSYSDETFRMRIKKSRAALSQILLKLSRSEFARAGFEVIFTRSEDNFNQSKRAIFNHYHILYSAPHGADIPGFVDFLSKMWVKTGVTCMLHSSKIMSREASTTYILKQTDVPISIDENDLCWYIKQTQSMRRISRHSTYKLWYSEFFATGDKITRVDDRPIRVQRYKHESDKESNEDLECALNSASKVETTDAKTSKFTDKFSQTPIIFCGTTQPRPIPGDIKSGWIIMSGFDQNRQIMAPSEGLLALCDVNDAAKKAYSEKTGEDWNEVKILAPLARKLLAWHSHEDARYRKQLQISPRIFAILQSIVDPIPGLPGSRTGREIVSSSDDWSVPDFALDELKNVRPGPCQIDYLAAFRGPTLPPAPPPF